MKILKYYSRVFRIYSYLLTQKLHYSILARYSISVLMPTSAMNTAKQIINQNKKEDWRNEWANNATGRSIFNYMTTPNPKDPINSLKREEQVTIFRLRSQHAPLNSHLKRIGVVTDSRCPLCPCPDETVAHFLFDCPTLNALRKEFLPPIPNITNTLYENPEQLRNTHRYFVMANSRRTQAQ